MKKIFTILAVLGALMFMVVPAQALIGMPDDQPGDDFEWWFLSGVPGLSTTETLLTVWNVGGAREFLHYTILTKESKSLDNDWETLTEWDMDSWTASYFISGMAETTAAQLLIDLDLDGTNDHYFGYIRFNKTGTRNVLLGHTMIADIAGGMFNLANVHMREWKHAPGTRFAGMTRPNFIGGELFSANSLANAMSAQQVNGLAVAATAFALYPRYYVNSSSGKSYLITWTDGNWDLDQHVIICDNNEDCKSTNIPLKDELNIIDMNDGYIPRSLYDTDEYPKEGWINLAFPDINGNGFGATREWMQWTWILDTGEPNGPYSGLAPVARQTFYTPNPVTGQPNP